MERIKQLFYIMLIVIILAVMIYLQLDIHAVGRHIPTFSARNIIEYILCFVILFPIAYVITKRRKK